MSDTSLSSPLAKKSVEILECDLYSPFLKRPGLSAEQTRLMRNVGRLMTNLTIYENLFTPTLTAQMTLRDDVNLSTLFPLVGVETLSLKFRVYSPLTNQWRVYGERSPLLLQVFNQTNRSPQTISSELFTLGLTSPEFIASIEKRLSRAFTNKPVEMIVEEVLRDYLATRKQYGTTTLAPDGSPFFEQTVSSATKPFKLVVPYMNPLDVIKLACLQAQTTEGRSNFLFYETLDGFYFRSLLQILAKGKAKWASNPVYVRRLVGGLSVVRDDERVISAEQIEMVSSFDTMFGLSQGYFSSTTIGVDVLAGQYRITPSSIADPTFQNKLRLNNRPLYAPNFAAATNPTARMFLMPTTSISAANRTLRAKDPSIVDNFLEQTISAKNRELLELQLSTVRVKVAGAPNINVGTVVYIDVPFQLNNSAHGTQQRDLRSGLYLIVAVKHMLINRGSTFEYETVFEACSDSVL